MEDITHLLAQSEQFPKAAGGSPFRVFYREVQQIEQSLKGIFEAITISSLERSSRALELASDIAKLFKD